jgi:hypothetical protein
MKRKWLKVLMMLMMAVASFGGPMNPKEIEDLMYVMNETRIEFTIPDENHKGEGGKVDPYGADVPQPLHSSSSQRRESDGHA